MSRTDQKERAECAAAIEKAREKIADRVVDACFANRPELDERYGEKGRIRCHEDSIYHLRYLCEAIQMESPSLFADYVRWCRALLEGYRIPADDLEFHLQILRDACHDVCSTEATGHLIDEVIDSGIEALKTPGDVRQSFIHEARPHHTLARTYLEYLLNGDRRGASALIGKAVEDGTPIRELYLHVFTPTQQELGRLWQLNQISVAQEHFCTAATQMIMSQLYSVIFNSDKKGLTMVGVSVGGELHEIGIRMIADMLELEGWDTYYIGANVPIRSVLASLEEQRADLLAISATMTFHIHTVQEMITAVRNDERFQRTKILVGGYPFNIDPTLWKRVGADGYAPDVRNIHVVAEQIVRGVDDADK